MAFALPVFLGEHKGLVVSKPFDLLNAFAAFGREQNLRLNDSHARERFGDHVAKALDQALNDPALLHGQRTQNMFEALVVSLGQFKLLKVEDAGRVHPSDRYRAPDFRVILDDDREWLIEVKNAYEAEPTKQRRRLMSAAYLQTLQNYAAAMNCPLKIAVYWARWGLWTLISPEKFAGQSGGVTVDMMQAVPQNEMAALGDMTVGTRPPLRLRLLTDPTKPRRVDENGQVAFTIGEAKLYCGEDEITLPIEKNIAWILIQFGDWEEDGPDAVLDGNVLEALEFKWTPRERPNEGQDFESIGTLSTMFSRHYATATLAAGDVIQTEADLVPGWFAPLTSKTYRGRALPLWKFILQPPAV